MTDRGKVVIKRSEWDREIPESGKLSGGKLHSSSGYCCLGFLALQAVGLTFEEIDGRDDLGCVDLKYAEDWHALAVDINDSPYSDGCFTSADQEEKLIALFSENGYDLTFTD